MARSRKRFPLHPYLHSDLAAELGIPEPLSEYDSEKLFGSFEDRFFWHHFSYRGRSLYHYTRQDAFISILSNQNFYISNVRHFSDYSEIEYAYEVLQTTISEFSGKATYGLERAFLEQVVQDAKPDQHDSYVLCFSTKYDDLNQWRSYAAPGLGYCIGFSTDSLSQLAERYGGRLGQCIYSRKAQREIINEALGYALRDLSTYFRHYGPGEINEGLVEARSKRFITHFSSIAPLFKNPAFSDESEVRLIFDIANSSVPIRFRSGNTSIVPFFEAGFQVNDLRAISPDTVVVKTCSRPEFVSASAKKFLIGCGYEKVSVSSSTIPFREGL